MYNKLILIEISLNNENNGLYEFQVKFKHDENNEFGTGIEEGVFFSDKKTPLVIGQEHEYSREGSEIILKGFLPKTELLKKIDKKKPVDIKMIEELRTQTIVLNKISYRVGWFYFLSIISLIASIIIFYWMLLS